MKTQNSQFNTVHRVLLAGGMLLMLMMSALTAREVARNGLASMQSVFRVIPALADINPININPTTCGTYTSPDGGYNEPFTRNGEIDPDCDNSPRGIHVCHGAGATRCFMQGPAPVAPPTFILAQQEDDPDEWDGRPELWTDIPPKEDSIWKLFYIEYDPQNPDNWKCFYGQTVGEDHVYCNDNLNISPNIVGSNPGTHHIGGTIVNINSNQDWYYSIQMTLQDETIIRSEVRTFDTHVENFTLTSPTPSVQTLTTGELSNYYSINVVPEGGYTGTVSLSGLNLPPSTSIQWEGGSTVVFNSGDVNPKQKRFRLQTTAGQPPLTPSGLYTFQIRGTDGDRVRENALPSPQLVVQDYAMTIDDTTTIQVPMSPGGVVTKVMEFERLPASQPYGFPINLTSNETFPWLTVSFSDSQVSDTDPSPQVTLTATAAAPQGPFSFKIFGTGTNTGQLRREITVNIDMAGAPDFVLTAEPDPLTVQQGLTGFYNLRMNAVNSPPGGMVIHLAASHELAGGGADSPPLDLQYVYKNQTTGAEVSQVTLNENGSVNTDIILEVRALSNAVCNSNPASEYLVRFTGTYNPGPSQVQKTDSSGLNVTCPAMPIFSLTATPTTRTIEQGELATYTITAQASGGFADYVDLSAINCPANATCSFAGGISYIDLRSTTTGTRDFLVQTNASIAGGNYYPRVHGTDRGGNAPDDEVQVELIVSEPVEFPTVSVTPNPLEMNEGENGSYTLSVQRNGYTEAIVVSWTPPSITNVVFVPSSGGVVFAPNETEKSVQVQTSTGSAGTYTLTFMFQNQSDPTEFQTVDVGLTIWSVSCSGDCENVCVDDNNVPGVPPVFCPNGQSDCPADTRCASQTCGVDGCVPDPLPGVNDCNEDSCYNADGTFIIPAVSPECHQSWPRCEDYTVLKVRKDRQCEQWLDCSSSVTFENPATGKLERQCMALGLCSQLGPDGRCAFTPLQGGTNQQVFNSPDDVTGISSKIRWFSGYSSGYHFSNQNEITTPYHPSFVQETGLDGATANDLVQNGTFEELRCLGGSRDNKSCIVSSDCRVGQGVCVQNPEPLATGASSGIPCQSNSECEGTQSAAGIATPSCRYLTSWGTDVDCRNPRDGKWLGVVPPDAAGSSAFEEAGFGFQVGDGTYRNDIKEGLRKNSDEDVTVHWEIWEDEENFSPHSLGRQIQEVPGLDPRYPQYSTERHLKDGNNNLKVELKSGASAFSGVGVPITDGLIAGGDGYVVSFKYKTTETAESQAPLRVQLGLNYEQRDQAANDDGFAGYNLTPANQEFITVGEIAGRNVCSANPAQTCSTDTDCSTVGGTCVDTIDWQEFVLGPISIPAADYDPSLTPVLSFVTTEDIESDAPAFYLDNVSMKPALEYAKYDDPSLELLKIARSCRLFPRDDSPECDYLDENATRYKGWRGYCLDKDPKSEDLCLTWWPLDILAGEGLFAVSGQQGYNGSSPLYHCMEQEGGPGYADQSFSLPHLGDYGRISWNTATGAIHTEWNLGSGNFDSDSTGDTAQIRLKDIERIDLLYDMNEDKWDGCDVRGAAATCEGGEHGAQADHTMFTIYPDQFNAVSSDNGYRITQRVFAGDSGELHTVPWSTIWNDNCSNSGLGGDDDQYFAARVSFSNPGDPNAAVLSGVELKVCDDRNNEIDRTSSYRVVIRTRQTCNYVVKTVTDGGGEPEEKAWAGRVNRFSNYSVPGLDIRFGQDTEIYGAILSPNPGADPTSWAPSDGWAPSADGPNAFQSIEPGTGSSLVRAGTPYSYRRDPIVSGASTQEQKFCFNPTAPNGPGDIGGSLNLNNSCETAGDVSACRSAGGTCVGRPANRCSGNLLFPCATDNDCSSLGFGQCIGSVDAGYDAGIRIAAAKQRLQRLFAASYGIWRLDARFVDPDPTVPGVGIRTSYVLDNTQAWDISTDGAECSGGERPSDFNAEYCFVRPRIDQLTINGQSNGNVAGSVGVPLNVRFSYTVNEQQKPAVQYRIQPDGAACGVGGYDDVPPGTTVEQAINYAAPGTYTPRVCIVDNWDIIGQFQYPGSIVIE